MKFLLLLAFLSLLQACQHEPIQPSPTNEVIAEQTVAQMQQTLETIIIGETTVDELTNFTKLSDTTYENSPITVTVEHGLVD